jgi:Tfp pilus assembly protein PilX
VSTTEIVVLIVVVLLLLALAAVLVARSRRRAHLQERFGPEYDRTLEQADGRRQAERDLAEREARRSSFDVRPLPAPTGPPSATAGRRRRPTSSTSLRRP